MFDFTETDLNRIAVHHIGNKNEEEGIVFSQNELQAAAELKQLLHLYFLSPFESDEFYSFHHETALNMNPVYNYAQKIFENEGQFFDISIKIAEHLYDVSEHPKIKSGEFYAVLLKNCVVEDEVVDALGLFKSETKDTFLKVVNQGDGFDIQYETGINVKKLDKGCLIFNTESDLGYKVSIIDKVNRSKEAQFWRDDFLRLKARKNDFYQTQNYMEVCKGFVENVYNEENQVEKPDQIDMLNRSLNYFQEKESFDEEDFASEVMMGEQDVVDAFKEYKKQYTEENELDLEENFDVSKNAVKTAKRKFKSVLKLDKNFHIYIHGDRNRIVKGFDKDKELHFYQVFFEEEK